MYLTRGGFSIECRPLKRTLVILGLSHRLRGGLTNGAAARLGISAIQPEEFLNFPLSFTLPIGMYIRPIEPFSLLHVPLTHAG